MPSSIRFLQRCSNVLADQRRRSSRRHLLFERKERAREGGVRNFTFQIRAAALATTYAP